MIIQELLEQRQDLFDIASILYGDDFICDENFWGSPTDLQLQEVHDKLDLFGYEFPEVKDEQIIAAKELHKIAEKGRNRKK